MSKEASKAGGLVVAALHGWSSDCQPVMVSSTWKLIANEEGLPGQGWGAPVGTPALLRPNKEPVRWLHGGDS